MIEQQGRVVGIEGGRALVRVGPTSGCPACDQGRGCGAGIFGRLLQRRPVVLRLDNRIHAAAGDAVTVAIPERLFLFLVCRLYLLPLLAGLAGAALGHHLGGMAFADGGMVDAAALAGAALGLVAALPRPRLDAEQFTDTAVRIVEAGGGAGCRGEDAHAGDAPVPVAGSDSNRDEVMQ